MTPHRVAAAVATGVVVAVLAVLAVTFGPLDALVAGVAAAVLVLVGGSLDESTPYSWPAVPHTEADGARPSVAVLTWSFASRDGKVSEAALRHLRQQAGRRLAGEGIVLDDGHGRLVSAPGGPDPGDGTRARELLGDRAWRVLIRRGDRPPVADVAHCIEAVERLGPHDPERRP